MPVKTSSTLTKALASNAVNLVQRQRVEVFETVPQGAITKHIVDKLSSKPVKVPTIVIQHRVFQNLQDQHVDVSMTQVVYEMSAQNRTEKKFFDVLVLQFQEQLSR